MRYIKNIIFILCFCACSLFVNAQNTFDTQNKLVNRLINYVKVYTQSDYNGTSSPTTEGQRDFAKMLAKELKSMGLQDVLVDEYSYLYATIPATIENAPTLFLSAHLDTTPDADLEGKVPNPIIHKYEGGVIKVGNLTINDALLKSAIGGEVITSDGATILGGDDKAGISIIMTLAEYLTQNKQIPHGDIRIVFTPDEEIGESVKYLTKEKLNADFGLVLDSHGFGRIVTETFNATDFTITIKTLDSGHPGYSNKVPAYRVAGAIISSFVDNEKYSAYNSSDKQGYIDYYSQEEVSSTEYKIKGRIRSFDEKEILYFEMLLSNWLNKTAKKYNMKLTNTNTNINEPTIILTLKDSYKNTKTELSKYPTNYKLIEQAYKKANVAIKPESARGGSDANDITFMGIPTYNIFAGYHNDHSKTEWVSSKQMEGAFNVVLNYITLLPAINGKSVNEKDEIKTQIKDTIKTLGEDNVLKKYINSFNSNLKQK